MEVRLLSCLKFDPWPVTGKNLGVMQKGNFWADGWPNKYNFGARSKKSKYKNFNQKVFNQLKYNGDDKEEKEDRYDDDDENYDFHRNVKQAK